jgi:transketolase
LSLNPPETETVPVDVFNDAIDRIEQKLGLASQPRAIVFHEKEGRRHAHCVWSRIDVEEMKAINLPHYKLKLRDISRELFLEYQWKMPRGLTNSEERDPLNFNLAEWQQAKSAGVDPRKVKEAIQDAWAISDSTMAFDHALTERGFRLARGDKRGHVAIDIDGNIFAVSRAVGVKARDVRAKLGDFEQLPTVHDMQNTIASAVAEKLKAFTDAQNHKLRAVEQAFETKRRALVEEQRNARQSLSYKQADRREAENAVRASRLPRGLKALWFRVTGAYGKIKRESDSEAANCRQRDKVELAALVESQLCERREIRSQNRSTRKQYSDQLKDLFDEIATRQTQLDHALTMSNEPSKKHRPSPQRSRTP